MTLEEGSWQDTHHWSELGQAPSPLTRSKRNSQAKESNVANGFPYSLTKNLLVQLKLALGYRP